MNALFEAYLECMDTLHRQIKDTVEGLPQAALDWSPGPEMNSIAVLVAHTAGSERFWIVEVALGEYVGRDREAEFRTSGLDAAELQALLDRSLASARHALSQLSDSDLGQTRTPAPGRKPVTLAWALMHALEHLGIHLGHIQVARQLWQQNM